MKVSIMNLPRWSYCQLKHRSHWEHRGDVFGVWGQGGDMEESGGYENFKQVKENEIHVEKQKQ